MSDSTNSTASSFNAADAERGYTIVYRAIDLLAFGVTVAAAWSCSSLVLGTIMFLVVGLVMAMLAYAAKLMTMLRVDPTKVETVGRVLNPGRITSFFSRKEAPTAA